MSNEILVRHGISWCKTATELDEGTLIISDDPQEYMGPDTFCVFEIRAEKSIHHVAMAPDAALAYIYAKAYLEHRMITAGKHEEVGG